jgi:hypothetical protein
MIVLFDRLLKIWEAIWFNFPRILFRLSDKTSHIASASEKDDTR